MDRTIRDIEDGEKPIAVETLGTFRGILTRLLSLAVTLFVLFTVTIYLIDPFEQRSAYVAACLMLIFLLFPFRKGRDSRRWISFLDYLLFALSLLVGLY